MSAIPLPVPAGQPAGPAIESMFQTIVGMLQKSEIDIGDLKKECSDLRVANASLERQLKEGLQNNHYRSGNQGFSTPSSPQLRATGAPRSPFLGPFIPQHVPSVSVSPSIPPLNSSQSSLGYPPRQPSRLGDNGLSYPVGPIRDIPGFYVVIPAGGAGTRLWPLSREDHPKFLLDLTLKGRSLLQATWDRLLPLSSAARTTIVAGPAHVSSIRDQLPDLQTENLFCEPAPKDSMAAIGLAAAVLARRDPEAIIGSFAADHMISGDDAFLSACTEAVEVARHDYLVTIGIAPAHPSTGFGYIRLGETLPGMPNAPNARKVQSFKEKPDARTAAAYIATGKYRWNAGMFVTKATFLMTLLKLYNKPLHDGLEQIAAVWDDETARQLALDTIWPDLEKIPIDNAVAEPAANEGRVAVIPATFGWDDVGDFSSLTDLLPAEENKPRILGDGNLVLSEQAAGGIVVPGSGRLISCLGVDNLVIVDMPDCLMITSRTRSQEVKRLVTKVREAGWKHLL